MITYQYIFEDFTRVSRNCIFHFFKKQKFRKIGQSFWCYDVLSMFVLSQWQRVALPMCWPTSVRGLFYCYHPFLDHTTNISRKVHAPRHAIASGAPNNVQNCHLDKTNMDKTSQHHNLLMLSLKKSCKIKIYIMFDQSNVKYSQSRFYKCII